MNAGKTTTLLQSAYNYGECGMKTLIFKSDFISGESIASRIGLKADAISANSNFNFMNFISDYTSKNSSVDCVLIDEVQFLTKNQILQLCEVVDKIKIPVLTYGLRTDFLGNTFTGSHYLLAWADEISEIKTMCMYGASKDSSGLSNSSDSSDSNTSETSNNKCNKKATMNIRVDENMNPLKEGEQISVGGNEKYISLCRKHYMKVMNIY